MKSDIRTLIQRIPLLEIYSDGPIYGKKLRVS